MPSLPSRQRFRTGGLGARDRSAGLREALGTDYALYERFVKAWREHKTPLGLNWLAWNLDVVPIGEAKVAITMRYAEKQGIVSKLKVAPASKFVKDGQTAWEPTEQGLAMFPEDAPPVLPSDVTVDDGSVRVTADSGEDARGWTEENGYTRVDAPGGDRALIESRRALERPIVNPKRPWLTEGDDEEA